MWGYNVQETSIQGLTTTTLPQSLLTIVKIFFHDYHSKTLYAFGG